jgi:hypothetical protein
MPDSACSANKNQSICGNNYLLQSFYLPLRCRRLPDISHPHVHNHSRQQAQCHNLRREQHSGRNKNHAISSNGFHQLIACFSSLLLLLLKQTRFFASTFVMVICGSCPWLVKLFISIVLIITVLCFIRGWSKWESLASAAATAASSVKAEAGTTWVASASARETSSAARESTTSAWEPTSRTETTAAEATLIAHHAEEDLRIDASHATAHTTTHTAAKHVGWIHQVVAIVVASLLPVPVVRRQNSNEILQSRNLLRIAQGLIGF